MIGTRFPQCFVFDAGGPGGAGAAVAQISVPHANQWFMAIRGIDRSVQKVFIRTPAGYAETDCSAVGSLTVGGPYRIGTTTASQCGQICPLHAVIYGAAAEGLDTAAMLARAWKGPAF